MSPSEQRALQAEKRAAWRQVGLNSYTNTTFVKMIVLNKLILSNFFLSNQRLD